jgi:hypothetical protein
MERKIVDCPETQKREEIDFERTPCGIVIAGCSRFEPRCAVACGARCAAVLDRDRRGVDDLDPRVLVVYAGGYGRTRALAEALAVHLSRDRLTVEVADADEAVPPPADYDAVVIGSYVRRGRHPRSVIEYISRHGDALAAMPAFFFSVGENDDLHREWRATGWLPNATAVFEAPRDGRGPLRALASWLRSGEVSVEDARFADGPAVRDFALKIAENIPSPGLIVAMLPPCKRTVTK